MINTMYISKDEIKDWLADGKNIGTYLEIAYKACIPTMLSPFEIDVRFYQNDHLVNIDFAINPQFIIGFRKSPHFILCVLYVFPKWRRDGLGSYLIRALQEHPSLNLMQVAVQSDKHDLKKFYGRLGFKTTDIGLRDHLGVSYHDFFWSKRNYTLTPTPNGTDVLFVD
jgi:GNAT superfamily N-acetyltransferase